MVEEHEVNSPQQMAQQIKSLLGFIKYLQNQLQNNQLHIKWLESQCKLPANNNADVKNIEENCVNSLGMNITIYRITLDGFTIGEFRDPYWASYLVHAIKGENDKSGSI